MKKSMLTASVTVDGQMASPLKVPSSYIHNSQDSSLSQEVVSTSHVIDMSFTSNHL